MQFHRHLSRLHFTSVGHLRTHEFDDYFCFANLAKLKGCYYTRVRVSGHILVEIVYPEEICFLLLLLLLLLFKS